MKQEMMGVAAASVHYMEITRILLQTDSCASTSLLSFYDAGWSG